MRLGKELALKQTADQWLRTPLLQVKQMLTLSTLVAFRFEFPPGVLFLFNNWLKISEVTADWLCQL